MFLITNLLFLLCNDKISKYFHMMTNNKIIHDKFILSKTAISNNLTYSREINEISKLYKLGEENKTAGFFVTNEKNETSIEDISKNFYKYNLLKQLTNVMISQLIKIDMINNEDILDNINIKSFNILSGGLFDNTDFFS